MDCDNMLQSELIDNNAIDFPKVGMLFDNLKNAYNYYNVYARGVGFSIKIKRTNKHRRDPNIIALQTLCCSCEGTYTKKNTPIKRREDRRFGCMAKFETKLNEDGKYELSKFNDDHTHELVPPSCAYLLRSHRQIEDSQAEVMRKMHSSGLKPSDIFYYFCSEVGGAGHLNFIQSDCTNLLGRERAEFLKKGDALCLVDYFKQKKQENKHFFYSFFTNEESEIRGIFFCDALSRRDYALYGDVICFDTTFRTNRYNLVCAPIVGVNNHGQTTIFGCGLLEGERSEVIIWMFKTFLEVMGGKRPGTIFTDQSAAIANAISVVFPEAHHRLCIWHIYQNAAKHLSKVFAEFKCFAKRFKHCVYDGETIEEFEESWKDLLEDYDLKDNEWLQGLYELRTKWAQVYARAYFCAGITTTQRSESINKFLKDYFSSTTILRVFVDQYTKAMASRRQKEREAENQMRQTTPILWSDWSVEQEASKIYTKKIFYLFQEEYKKNLDYRLKLENEVGTIQTYNVARLGKIRRGRTVTYCQSDQLVNCSCRKFEFEGILCSHILKLFRELDFASLPPQYYLKRWTRAVVNDVVYDSYGDSIPSDIDPKTTTRYSKLSHVYQRLLTKGSKSDRLCSLSLSKMLAFEVELDMEIANEEEESDISLQKRKNNPNINTTPTANEDAQLRIPQIKRARGELKGRAKDPLEKRKTRKTTSKQIEAATQTQGGPSSFNQVRENQNILDTIGVLSSMNQPVQTAQNQVIQDPRRVLSTEYHPTQVILPPPYGSYNQVRQNQNILDTIGVLSSMNQPVQTAQNQVIQDPRRVLSTEYHPTQVILPPPYGSYAPYNFASIPAMYNPFGHIYLGDGNNNNSQTSARKLDFEAP